MIFLVLTAVWAAPLKPYKIDKNHSNIGFAVPILGGLSKVRGKFSDFEIELLADEKDITKSTVKARIKAASIDTGIDARDEHLRTADFFDVEKFPEITFESRRIIKKGNRNFIARGDLTMHGVTREIDLPFFITGVHKDTKEKSMNIGYAARLTLNRRDFGINWTHSVSPDFVGDEIEIEINLITRLIKTD
ncbi:MAG: YceI family protein [Pyrinomonadaceae bacterium]